MNSLPPASSKGRILIADDEDNTRSAIARALQLMGYQAEGAVDGEDALRQLSQNPCDLLLLDLQMPGVDGVQVMQTVQKNYPNLAVIVLTAHASLPSAIAAVKAGASDYLLKPQHISEIEKIISQTLQRRSPQTRQQRLRGIIEEAMQLLDEGPKEANPPANNPLDFNSSLRRVIVYQDCGKVERQVELTAGQAAIFTCLSSQPGKVLSSQEIATQALGYLDLSPREADRIVRPHILRLRQKVEREPTHPCLIRTVRGAGYLYQAPVSD